jgi:cell division septation protein DedD
MSVRILSQYLPMLLFVLLMSACSSSDEVSKSDQQSADENGTFQRVDKEEAIIPETEEPVKLEVVEDEDVPAMEKPVPVKSAGEDVPPSTGTTPPARQETTPETTQPAQAAPPRTGTMMWSVQLGAYKSEAGAFQIIDELKQKFNHPVYKRYDPVTGYYKVTMGSFQTREQAAEFKLEVQSRGYPDAFTVEVAR